MDFFIWLTTALFLIAPFECRDYSYDPPQKPFQIIGGAPRYQTPLVQQVQRAVVRSLGTSGKNYEVFLTGSKQIYEERQPGAQSYHATPPSSTGPAGYARPSGHLTAPRSYGPLPLAPNNAAVIHQQQYQTQPQYAAAGAPAGRSFAHSNSVNPLVQSSAGGGNAYLAPAPGAGDYYQTTNSLTQNYAGAGGQNYGGAGGQNYGGAGGQNYGPGGQPAANTQFIQGVPQQQLGGPITHYEIVTVGVAAKGATQHPPNVEVSGYVTQSEIGQLDHYTYKQIAGDVRAYDRELTDCYPGGKCENSHVPAGHSQPRHEHVVLAARARISVLPDKCRQLKLQKAAAAAAAAGKDASSVDAASLDPSSSQYAGRSYNKIQDSVRPKNRRLFPYAEVEEIQDIFN